MDNNAKKLVDTLWPSSSRKARLTSGQEVKSLTFEAYCGYYKRQIEQAVPRSGKPDIASYSLINIISLMQLLRLTPDHEAALDLVRSQTPVPSDTTCKNLVNLAAQLLLMVKVTDNKQWKCMDWAEGSLRDLVRGFFIADSKLDCANIGLPKFFNAWSIAVVAGIELVFTDNLADHLRLIDDSILCVFHHASFLELQQNSMFPDDFVDETLRTLALLFPQADFSTAQCRTFMTRSKQQKWFQTLRQENRHLVLDPRIILCGNLKAENRQIESFHFWRDRLIILKRAFDRATPRTFRQWWHDGRDGVQWSTFWVAILVLMITTSLGVIQCVEGALQVYKSFA